MLRKKLQRSYDAAPFGIKQHARKYTAENVVSRIKTTTTQEAWSNELGGLLLRPRPDRLAVVEGACRVVKDIGDISLD